MKNPEAFATIPLKESIAKRFNEYSTFVATTQLESTEVILDFFFRNNEISLRENVGPHFRIREVYFK